MRRIAVLVVTAGLLMTGFGPASAAKKPVMVVIGDSISASSDVPAAKGGFIYDDVPHQSRQAWWSFLRRETGYRARVYAEAGSGYHQPGRNCALTSFAQRVQRPAVRANLKVAKVVVVEGGVNDAYRRTCAGETTTFEEDVDTTLRLVKKYAPRAKLIVTAPWGTNKKIQPNRSPTVRTIKAAAKKYGFSYVNTSLSADRTSDGVHPNRKGVKYIAKKVRSRM